MELKYISAGTCIPCMTSSSLLCKLFFDSVHENFTSQPLSSTTSSSLFKLSYSLGFLGFFCKLVLLTERSVFSQFLCSQLLFQYIYGECGHSYWHFQHELHTRNSKSFPLFVDLLRTGKQVYHL